MLSGYTIEEQKFGTFARNRTQILALEEPSPVH